MSELNDPRVFFAAERTLLAWTRTSLTLMAFGFMVERFGLFLRMFGSADSDPVPHGFSFWIGVSFMLIGAFTATVAAAQYRRVLKTMKPIEIPRGYRCHLGIVTNLAVTLLGTALTLYLFLGSGL